jgi:predicted TIM-barrel enzyme
MLLDFTIMTADLWNNAIPEILRNFVMIADENWRNCAERVGRDAAVLHLRDGGPVKQRHTKSLRNFVMIADENWRNCAERVGRDAAVLHLRDGGPVEQRHTRNFA